MTGNVNSSGNPQTCGENRRSGVACDVLLIEANTENALKVQETLSSQPDQNFSVQWLTSLPEALARIHNKTPDVVLVSLNLPGFPRLEGFHEAQRAAPGALVLPLNEAGSCELSASRPIGVSWLPETLRYVTRLKKLKNVLNVVEDALLEEQERLQTVLSSINEAVVITDTRGDVVCLNNVAEMMTGWTQTSAIGRPLSKVVRLVDAATGERCGNPALAAVQGTRDQSSDTSCSVICAGGQEIGVEHLAAPIPDGNGHYSGAALIFRDINDSRTVTRRMAYLAHHDQLTGLANRALMQERLDHAIRMTQRHGKKAALLFVDLDNFKPINDSLGHSAGDQVLKTVARFLKVCVRATDTVCRLGGDEFLVLLSEVESSEDAAHVAEKILATFATPMIIEGHPLRIKLSIGISIYPEDGETAESVIQKADIAMYRAKTDHTQDYAFAPCNREKAGTARRGIDAQLQRALEKDEFILHFQPRYDLSSGKVCATEALLRWRHPAVGLLYPKTFMPQAQRSGLILPIGRWVLRQSCRQLHAWRQAGLNTVPLSINVSTLELRDEHFTEFLTEVLHESELEPGMIELELPECVLSQNSDVMIDAMRRLRNMGVGLAIDDFGAGASQLKQLRTLPITTLKLDGSLLLEVSADPGTSVILGSIISLGQRLQHRVVAEGVETLQQLGFLQAHLCDEAQGFQLGRPMSADHLASLLGTHNGTQAPAKLSG